MIARDIFIAYFCGFDLCMVHRLVILSSTSMV